MAVIDQIKVTVSVDGQDLKEYEDDHEVTNEHDTIIRYVEAQSGKPFSVNLELPKWYPMDFDLVAETRIDGDWVLSPLLLKQDVRKASHVYRSFSDGSIVQGSDGSKLRPWLFSQINEVENNVRGLPTRDISDLKEMGVIYISLYSVRLVSISPITNSITKDRDEAITLREKETNKGGGLTHTTRFGHAKSVEKQLLWNATRVDDPKAYVARFNFRYRSRRALQSMLLIPRTPSPTPLEELDVNTLNPDQMRQVIRIQQERARQDAETKQRLKREIKEEEDQFRTNPAKRAKIRPFAKSEFIDLDDLVD